MNTRRFMLVFFAIIGAMLLANLISLHFRSNGGFLEGLGLVNNLVDDIRAFGFPFLVWEEGGFAYRNEFHWPSFLGNLAIIIALALGVGVVAARRGLANNPT